jgi:predicted phage terminase large subunit-like protein
LSNREAATKLLKKDLAESHFRDYIPVVWDVLEPGRKFVSGWAVDAICEHLQAVSEGEIKKLLINVPPGCMKSLNTCVLWPSWEWGPRDQSHLRYVCASYSEQLTVRDNRRCRNVITSDIYQALWGDRFSLVGDQNAKVKYETDRAGFKIATSVGGLGTGERGDRLIIDDPHNVKEGESDAKREGASMWFSEVMSSRVTDPELSAYVVIMQRVHERDISGLILSNDLGYEHLCLPMEFEPDRRCWTKKKFSYIESPRSALVYFNDVDRLWQEPEAIPETMNKETLKSEIRWEGDPRKTENELLWPERFTRRYLEEDLKPTMRSWGGTYAEAGQLQQRPAPRGGGMFQRADFQFIEPEEARLLKGRIARGWDLAASEGDQAAYSASAKGMIDEKKRFIVLDVTRFKKLPGATMAEIESTTRQDGPRVQQDLPQDPGQAGKSQKSYIIRELHGYNVTFSPETGDKTVRATPVASQAEGHNMYLVRGPWNDAYINELTVFPKGRYKDQTDATSRLYSNLLRKTIESVGAAPRIIEG